MPVLVTLIDPATYFGSGCPSGRGFIESLHNDLKTKKASFWRMWENGSLSRSSSPMGGIVGVEAVLGVFSEPTEGAADRLVLVMESGVLTASSAPT